MDSIIPFLIVLGVLVFFHELGHFLVAKLFGVGVEKFSLGFGPRILGKTVGLTDYRLSAIPLGGYVKMVGEEPDAEIDPKDIPISFTHKPVYQRMLIVAAGPVFNFFLAILIYYAVFQISGIPVFIPIIGDVQKDSPAQKSGFKLEDRVMAINGDNIDGWRDIADRVSKSQGKSLEFLVQREGETLSLKVTPELSDYKNLFGEEIKQYDIGINLLTKPIINNMEPGLPAQKAGLKQGDIVTAIDDTPIHTWDQLAEKVLNCGGKKLTFKILRKDEVHIINVTPSKVMTPDHLGKKHERFRIGISIPTPDYYQKKLNPIQAMSESMSHIYFISEISILSVVKLISGTISAKDTFGGPILIAQTAGKMAKKGTSKFLEFIAWISISLAILNLLPIPVLDGGHLIFFSIEGIRGKPVSIRAREIAQQGGIALLLLLMVFVFYFDITRFFSG